MQRTQIRDFTRGNISKQLIVFAWPLFLSNLLQVVYNMVDMVVVGQVIGVDGGQSCDGSIESMNFPLSFAE